MRREKEEERRRRERLRARAHLHSRSVHLEPPHCSAAAGRHKLTHTFLNEETPRRLFFSFPWRDISIFQSDMWIYKILLCVVVLVYSETKRHALQDYQKTDAIRLVTPPGEYYLSKGRKMSLGKCARRCTRSRKLQFICSERTACTYFMRECIIGNGLNYKGKRSVTKSGVQCQLWDSMTPHEHNFLPERHARHDLRENLCRNPDNTTTGPWCFTTDPKTRHQDCSIPQCSEVECVTCNGESYRGPMDHTESGRECQRWDLQEPHQHIFHHNRYPDKGLKDNYCRNPDGRQRPWCFTTDPSTPWEYCNIKQCDSDTSGDIENTTTCFHGRGEGYRGIVGITPEGVTCQRWDVQFPHRHTFIPMNYHCKDLRENYCRNPDGQHLPWCFTTDPNVPIAFCTNIPRCGVKPLEPEALCDWRDPGDAMPKDQYKR
ncbi:hypothetical protein DNTS_016344 [Danionella cerebrum]|uniref:Kringle domain-containing protein n=1 Tax=Danionella cerebrum TaxID=2873325 RepID=A0A553RH09_9TELE|nr:hypothetical protein DNTS_016344 [Danionella translucida]